VIGTVVALAATAALALPAAGVSASSPAPGAPGAVSAFTDAFGSGNHAVSGMSQFGSAHGTMVSTSLMQNTQAHPRQVFHVIVTGTGIATNTQLAKAINSLGKSGRQFKSITGVTATITGADLQTLAKKYPKLVQAITPDRVVRTADYENSQMWSTTADVTPLWPVINRRTGLVSVPAPQAPAIAFIDSGVNAADTADFGSRVVATADFCSLCTDGPTGADLEGHGTMVAGIAAGSSPQYPGVAQNAPIVSIRVADANGESMESDVIAACGWIQANASKYGIKVVNISMAGASPTSIQFDPLDKAVEQLWFQGITVVAAAGNFGTGSAVDMSAAPGNDPFIITVGATDQNLTSTPADDTITPWSAFGYTADGFSKPDISAPGRYLIMPVPMGSTIPLAVPSRVVAPGYMWMSGTSFSSPVVAGAAAQILARHPNWTPDQVKGALMLTASYLPFAGAQAGGVGEVDAARAANLLIAPPNPNVALDAFVSPDPTTGAPAFSSAAWSSAVSSNAAWASAAWSSAAWASAAWSSAAWASAAWSSAAWSSSVNSAMTSLATYTEATYAP
jgi:serine protease AprX